MATSRNVAISINHSMFLMLSVEQNEISLDVQLYSLVAFTPLGEYIKSEVFISDLKERVYLYELYLSDFLSSVYRTTRNDEVKVVTCTVINHYSYIFSVM